MEYATVENGLEGRLPDDDREKYASDFDAELETAQIIETRLLREQEIRDAALKVWDEFATWMPHSAHVFTENGLIAP